MCKNKTSFIWYTVWGGDRSPEPAYSFTPNSVILPHSTSDSASFVIILYIQHLQSIIFIILISPTNSPVLYPYHLQTVHHYTNCTSIPLLYLLHLHSIIIPTAPQVHYYTYCTSSPLLYLLHLQSIIIPTALPFHYYTYYTSSPSLYLLQLQSITKPTSPPVHQYTYCSSSIIIPTAPPVHHYTYNIYKYKQSSSPWPC